MSAGLVKAFAPPPVPAGLADRIVADVLADFPRRRRLRLVRQISYAGMAMAAAILAAIWLMRPAPSPAPIPAKEMLANADAAAPNLKRDLGDAGTAVAALTRRAADEVAEIGKQLLPPSAPPLAPPQPVRPLGDAAPALANGFEPITSSARRAARLVLREFAMEDARK